MFLLIAHFTLNNQFHKLEEKVEKLQDLQSENSKEIAKLKGEKVDHYIERIYNSSEML